MAIHVRFRGPNAASGGQRRKELVVVDMHIDWGGRMTGFSQKVLLSLPVKANPTTLDTTHTSRMTEESIRESQLEPDVVVGIAALL